MKRATALWITEMHADRHAREAWLSDIYSDNMKIATGTAGFVDGLESTHGFVVNDVPLDDAVALLLLRRKTMPRSLPTAALTALGRAEGCFKGKGAKMWDEGYRFLAAATCHACVSIDVEQAEIAERARKLTQHYTAVAAGAENAREMTRFLKSEGYV